MKSEVKREYITYREAADILGVSYQTVIRWTRRGRDGSPPRLPAYKVGERTVRIKLDELMDLIKRAQLHTKKGGDEHVDT